MTTGPYATQEWSAVSWGTPVPLRSTRRDAAQGGSGWTTCFVAVTRRICRTAGSMGGALTTAPIMKTWVYAALEVSDMNEVYVRLINKQRGYFQLEDV